MSFSFGSVYSQNSANTARLGTWDKPVSTDHFRDRMNNELYEFRTFIFHSDYRDYSVEEHRLEDYKHGKGCNAVHTTNPNVQNSFAPKSELLIKKTSSGRNKMELFQGSGVEIQVGTKTPLPSWNGTKTFETWCLPRNLASHYSPYLKEISSSNLQESIHRIKLQHYQPAVFGLFVEWLYYGSYESSSSASISNPDAKCWALGNKLRSIEFQNYAMRRLYEQHTRPFFGRPVTCDDVRYAWDNTPPDSKLRKFYVNFVVEHFGSSVRLLGSSTDWDTLLQTHSEIRIPLLNKFRHSTFWPSRVGTIAEYLESNNLPSNLPRQPKSEPIQLATGTKTEKAPLFNFNEKPGEKKDSPQKREPFQLAARTKNYEGAALKFGWKYGESTDNSPSSSNKTSQPKQDSPPELDDELVLGHANQCITSVDKSDDVNKSSETRKGKEPAEGATDNSKKSGLGEAALD